MIELFSPAWMQTYLNQWNAEPELADALATIHETLSEIAENLTGKAFYF
ncbi:hypothetical protein [Acaryochloris sp. CCMEE 5410]|nr:hypothetical protein [Acaryochloris sp. CCMEE 5410]